MDLSYIEALQYKLSKAWALAETERDRQHTLTGDKQNITNLHEGDLVLLKLPDYPGRAAKLGSTWKGPLKIHKIHENNNVELQDLDLEYPPIRVHRRRVKLYKQRAEHLDSDSEIENFVDAEGEVTGEHPELPSTSGQHQQSSASRFSKAHLVDPNLDSSDDEN